MVDEDIIDLESFTTFFHNYNSFCDRYWEQQYNDDIKSITSLFSSYQILDKELDIILKNEAPYYNVFKILNIKHYEAKVHTPFLCNLLDPNGSHQQGDLFVSSFLKDVLKFEMDSSSFCDIHIYEECSFDDGRMDIFLEFKYSHGIFGVVIENKIYAPDQNQQLLRYYKHMLNRFKEEKNFYLVYLTPMGLRPSPRSISVDLAHKLRSCKCLKEVSYSNDIIPWLEKCEEQIVAQNVRNTIKQYIKTLYYI